MTLIFRMIPAAVLVLCTLAINGAINGALAQSAALPGHDSAPANSAAPADLQILPASQVKLKNLVWKSRPLVVFADNPAVPAFGREMQYLRAGAQALAIRDVVVITDTDPSARSAIREKLRPIGFSIVLLDKSGQVAKRRPVTWSVREIIATIDNMPIRREELRNQ